MKLAWRRATRAKGRAQLDWCKAIVVPPNAVDTDSCIGVFENPSAQYVIPQLCVLDYHAMNTAAGPARADALGNHAAKPLNSKAFFRARHEDGKLVSVVFKPDREPGLYAIMKGGRQKLQVNLSDTVTDEMAQGFAITIAKKYVKSELVDTELYTERDRAFTAKGLELPKTSRKARSRKLTPVNFHTTMQ